MKKQVTLAFQDPEIFYAATDLYFLESDFQKGPSDSDTIIFNKGNGLLNFLTFSPLNWKTTVTIDVDRDIATAVFDINTAGQMVTPLEEELWDSFIENYKISIEDDVDMICENSRNIKEVKKGKWSYVKLAILGAMFNKGREKKSGFLKK